MNVARRISLLLSLAILACVSALHSSAESFWAEHKVFSGKPPIRTACLMPPEADLVKLGVKTSEKMPKESDDWSRALKVLVWTHLSADGIAIGSATDALSSGASYPDIQQAIQQIQQKYDALSGTLYKKPKEIEKGAYTLDDQVAMLPCAANSDVLVFVQGAGAVPTPGRQAMGALGGSILTEGAVVYVTFADAKTGEIMAMIRFHNVGDFLTDEEGEFATPLDAALADINLGSARKVERAREAASPDQR
ncbi:MAG: hypothetical protein ABSE36_08180 [Terracidiphilus sp.]|jgi:hypothetical protein